MGITRPRPDGGVITSKLSREKPTTVLCKSNENEFRSVLFEISPNFRSTFRSVRATVKTKFRRQFAKASEKSNRKIASSNFQSREISKKIYIKSNEMSANFPTPEKHELTRQNVNNHFNRV